MRRPGSPNSNRNAWPAMAPHGIYPGAGDDEWIAISCRDDAEWEALRTVAGAALPDRTAWASVRGRLDDQDALDAAVAAWTRGADRFATAAALRAAGVAAAPVRRPAERIDGDPATGAWPLWPTVAHGAMGDVRVDGLPVHLSETDWDMTTGAPLLGEHNDVVYGDLLGLSSSEIDGLRAEGVI